ncbi:OmpA family protein [Variovorax sp. J22P271]|uniref:OmpA family protein n=1 Tax=Variovorax davisae TaxID=3053515 RepID=UPI0025760F4C|nr:OmpA family protein [Variovorax sp. J22P271]MDM0037069.1 OmpA family protein [Variovorax sp. J22P271]
MQTKTSSSLAPARRLQAGSGFLACALSALCLATAAPAAVAQQGAVRNEARPAPQAAAQGPAYRPVPGVADDQAQIVYFRSAPAAAGAVDGEAAHVYVDGEFHTALQPHSFTRFCVPNGSHAIEAYIGDAPKFEGKLAPRTRVALEGGKTYFVGVSENRSGDPLPVLRPAAEKQLEGALEQVHFVPRASTVVPCREVAQVAAPEKIRYTLNADVLFVFAKSDHASITPRGREELRKVADEIRQHSPSTVTRISVRGHADPIGSVRFNKLLSEQRARTVARVLTEEGIAGERLSFEGLGSSEPVVSCPSSGSKQASVACNAPNRRVEILGEGVK